MRNLKCPVCGREFQAKRETAFCTCGNIAFEIKRPERKPEKEKESE